MASVVGDLVVASGTVHRATGWEHGAYITVTGDRIVDVAVSPPDGAALVDACGCLVLPGLVDLHCDAFERHLAPRGRAHLDVATALELARWETRAWGVTTPFFTVRLPDATAASLSHLESALDAAGDAKLHVRVELTAAADMPAPLLTAPPIALVTVNNHAANALSGWDEAKQRRYIRSRYGADEAAADAAVAAARRPLEAWYDAIALVAARARAVLGYHDLRGTELAAFCAGLGFRYAEFPVDEATTVHAAALGLGVVVGAPNVVRGGSHNGQICATAAIRQGHASALCSDYHLPSLLLAPFVLARERIMPLHEAWSLVSRAPAALAGLHDRGNIEPGFAADFVIVEPGWPPRLAAVVQGGEVTSVAAGRSERFRNVDHRIHL
jgi:alpha-D-ribose 1-methylphosphonate 5-triphosphate diphosphatase